MSPFSPPGQTRERVYQVVRQLLEQGQPPTVREVQRALGFRAVETARQHLLRLVEEGRLVKEPAGRARGYRLPQRDRPPSVAVPLLGRVPAGDLREAIEHREGAVPVAGESAEGLFALRVEGDSMIDAGILPGDLVIVRAQRSARSGDIVIAMVAGEATMKTLRRNKGSRSASERKSKRVWRLVAANPEYPDIVPDPRQLTILGKVIEVRRRYSR